jgi:hypothetical protein
MQKFWRDHEASADTLENCLFGRPQDCSVKSLFGGIDAFKGSPFLFVKSDGVDICSGNAAYTLDINPDQAADSQSHRADVSGAAETYARQGRSVWLFLSRRFCGVANARNSVIGPSAVWAKRGHEKFAWGAVCKASGRFDQQCSVTWFKAFSLSPISCDFRYVRRIRH